MDENEVLVEMKDWLSEQFEKIQVDIDMSEFLSGNNENVNFTLTNNPIENYMKLLQNENNTELTNVPKHNRTLVIVYGDSESTSDFQERAARLIGSLNTHETIKAIVITITGDKFYRGLTFQNPPSELEIDPVKLKEMTHGFVQLVEVKDARV